MRNSLLLSLMIALASIACAPLPPGRYTLDKVQVTGNSAVDDDDIESVIASQPSARFLGVLPGFIYDYSVFDRFVLERDLQRIERYYHAQGYYHARVRAARVTYKGRGARVLIEVEEGPATVVQRVDVHGLDELPEPVRRRANAAVSSELPLGAPLKEESFENAAKALKDQIEDEGYAYVDLKRSAEVDLPRNRASIGFWIKPGPKAEFGNVRIEGLGPLPEPPVRRALDLQPGQPYSRFDLDEAKRALLDLNVFSTVSIEPELTEEQLAKKPRRVPILVRVEPSKLRSVHAGVGVQIDTQSANVHLIAGWEHNNFFGGFRRFLVEARPGLVFYPTRLPDVRAPEHVFPALRLRNEFRQPGFLEARTNLLLRAQMNIDPLLLSTKYNPDDKVIGYQDVRASAGLERSFWKLYGVLSHNVQLNYPFSYLGDLDPDLKTVWVSYPELLVSLDLRDDRVSPHRGAYVSLDTQVAGVGGQARDLKIQPEARAYVPLARKWTFASRATVGFLFPQNYGGTVEHNSRRGVPHGRADPALEPGERANWIEDIELMFMRGFFSGGSGSNRGYAAREIGPHGTVPFYNPGQSVRDTETGMDGAPYCPEKSGVPVKRGCNLPLGGFTLWEASVEVRYPISGPLSGTVFSDASDVSPNKASFRFNRPHLTVGLGFRYATPIGPVRLDAGYRVPGAQAPSTAVDEVEPSKIFGVPVAATFGIGEAF
ncbi:MAG TPA: BamA/TamA family outer membrane protein [Polyangiaceae bacterium]|nr:BamA/TamA family outer membrane protein [Polyangiaceae bacterium]